MELAEEVEEEEPVVVVVVEEEEKNTFARLCGVMIAHEWILAQVINGQRDRIDAHDSMMHAHAYGHREQEGSGI